MQASTSSATLVDGSLPGQRNFDFTESHNDLLKTIAGTNVVSTPWEELRSALMYRIAQNLAQMPLVPPRRNGYSEESSSMQAESSVDPNNRDEASLREKEDLQQQIWDALDNFENDAPFTIQRLAELAIDPTKHYKTSIKYLRAVYRTIQVSSSASAYIADTYALSPGPAESSILGHVSTTSAASTSPLLRSSTSPSTSPLLTPIPWITPIESAEDSDGDSMHLDAVSSSPHIAPINGHDASLAEGGSPSLPTASPTGGRVDELDPLPPSLTAPQETGMAESPSPISDPQGSPPRAQHSPDYIAGSPPRGDGVRRPSF